MAPAPSMSQTFQTLKRFPNSSPHVGDCVARGRHPIQLFLGRTYWFLLWSAHAWTAPLHPHRGVQPSCDGVAISGSHTVLDVLPLICLPTLLLVSAFSSFYSFGVTASSSTLHSMTYPAAPSRLYLAFSRIGFLAIFG